jgi:hypothetical protein
VAQSNHRDKSPQLTQNQNNKMSEDPGDGSRNSDTLGGGQGEPVEVSPEEKAQQDEDALEAFGEEGAGIAAKE